MTASLCDGELPLKDRAEQAGWRRRPIGRASAATLNRITVLSNSSKDKGSPISRQVKKHRHFP